MTDKNKKILKIVLAGIVVLAVGWWGWSYWEKYQSQRIWEQMKEKAEQFENEQARLKALIEADTFGGTTPQETLEMFIKAVEAGDYELASKYFVVEKQEEELESLQKAPIENIQNVMELLKETKNYEGAYLNDNKYFIDDPILVDFIKYPNGIWKINEI